MLKGSILCRKISVGILRQVSKVFLYVLLVCYYLSTVIKKPHKNDFQKSFYSVLEYYYNWSFTCCKCDSLYHSASKCYLQCYSIHSEVTSWGLQGSSFSFCWFQCIAESENSPHYLCQLLCFPKGWTEGHCASHDCVWSSTGSFSESVKFLK